MDLHVQVSGTQIIATGVAIFNCSNETLFNYVADLANDKNWRGEITRTDTNGQPRLNCIATEHSFLSKKLPDHTNVLVCRQFENGKRIVYETEPTAAFYLKSDRTVESQGAGSQFTYVVAFDSNIVKHALGFGLPKWLIAWKTRSDMKKYLSKLAAVLGSGKAF